jgi:hypothetical protein
MDPRIERKHIDKHARRQMRDMGRSLIWYEFRDFDEPSGSEYDQIYDMGPAGPGGRAYRPGIVIPFIHIEEIEDEISARPDGRQAMQNVVVKMLMDDFIKVGIDSPWEYEARLNDIFYFDNRYFSVYRYRPRGLLKGEVVVMVYANQVYLDQEYVFDEAPQESVQNLPWPDLLPNRSV